MKGSHRDEAPPARPREEVEPLLDRIEREAFDYFLTESNPDNGLVGDTNDPASPASIAAVGMALAAYPAGAERGFCEREQAKARELSTLRFFHASPQGRQADASGYKGFYYHYLDRRTGHRVRDCELSTIDTAFFIAGALAAAAYFDRADEEEAEIRRLADRLYRRIEWAWASSGGPKISHGWKPESGFLRNRWDGYTEALLLYALALGSPTHPVAPESYDAWLSTYSWKKISGIELLYAGPLAVHQLSHAWIDLRGIRDAFMKSRGIDYFENSRRAAIVQQDYASRNPHGFAGYGKTCWGFTASDGPGPATRTTGGAERVFFGYAERGAPYGPDDGTVSPWAAAACLPFAPEIVLPTIESFADEEKRRHGLAVSFNPTWPESSGGDSGWVSPRSFGLHRGPIVLMIENFRSELPWRLMKKCPPLVAGLRRAGFTGGWL
jgi:hypothetical protein